MHSGMPHPNRHAPRDSDAYWRPLRIHDIELRANDDGTVDGAGAGVRGGSWYTDAGKGRVADRSFGAGLTGYSARSHDTGVCGVRTSPEYDQ